MIKLYNHTCFEKYPHFQLAELQNSSLSQNSTRIGGKTSSCVYHPHANHTTAECEKLKAMNTNGTPQRSKGKGKGKPNKGRYGNRSSTPRGKGKGKGRGGKGKGKGRGNGTPFDGECRNCGKTGHMARDCYSRKAGNQTFQQNQQKVSETTDEATLQFSQFAVHTNTDTPPNHDMDCNAPSEEDSGTGRDENDIQSESESEVCDMDFQPISGSSSEDTQGVNQSSDVYNAETRTERLRLFHTWGENPLSVTTPRDRIRQSGA